jgi:hypothetical protein
LPHSPGTERPEGVPWWAISSRAGRPVSPTFRSTTPAAYAAGPGPSEWRRADFDLFEKLAALGVTVQEAASFFSVSRSTMNRRLREPAYRRAWDRGQVNVKIALRRAQLKRALEGSDPMLIWMGKQLLGQKNHPEPSEPLPRDDREVFITVEGT